MEAKMKKVLAIILVLVLSFALVSCGKKEEEGRMRSRQSSIPLGSMGGTLGRTYTDEAKIRMAWTVIRQLKAEGSETDRENVVKPQEK